MQQKMASVLPATGTTALAEPHRAVKRPRAPRKSVTESMDSAAEQLWSAKTRDFLVYIMDPPPRRCVTLTGCGPKYRGARVQPLTRGPEADETKTMTVTLPHRV